MILSQKKLELKPVDSVAAPTGEEIFAMTVDAAPLHQDVKNVEKDIVTREKEMMAFRGDAVPQERGNESDIVLIEQQHYGVEDDTAPVVREVKTAEQDNAAIEQEAEIAEGDIAEIERDILVVKCETDPMGQEITVVGGETFGEGDDAPIEEEIVALEGSTPPTGQNSMIMQVDNPPIDQGGKVMTSDITPKEHEIWGLVDGDARIEYEVKIVQKDSATIEQEDEILDGDIASIENGFTVDEARTAPSEQDVKIVNSDTTLEKWDVKLVDKDNAFIEQNSKVVEGGRVPVEQGGKILKIDIALEEEGVKVKEGDEVLKEHDAFGLPDDMAAVKEEILVVKCDIAPVEQEILVVEDDITPVEQGILVLEDDIAPTEQDSVVVGHDIAIIERDLKAVKEGIAPTEPDIKIEDSNTAFIEHGNMANRGDSAPLENDFKVVEINTSSIDKEVDKLMGNDTAPTEQEILAVRDGAARMEGDSALIEQELLIIEGETASTKEMTQELSEKVDVNTAESDMVQGKASFGMVSSEGTEEKGLSRFETEEKEQFEIIPIEVCRRGKKRAELCGDLGQAIETGKDVDIVTRIVSEEEQLASHEEDPTLMPVSPGALFVDLDEPCYVARQHMASPRGQDNWADHVIGEMEKVCDKSVTEQTCDDRKGEKNSENRLEEREPIDYQGEKVRQEYVTESIDVKATKSYESDSNQLSPKGLEADNVELFKSIVPAMQPEVVDMADLRSSDVIELAEEPRQGLPPAMTSPGETLSLTFSDTPPTELGRSKDGGKRAKSSRQVKVLDRAPGQCRPVMGGSTFGQGWPVVEVANSAQSSQCVQGGQARRSMDLGRGRSLLEIEDVRRIRVVDVELYPRDVPCIYHPERNSAIQRRGQSQFVTPDPVSSRESSVGRKKSTVWKRLKTMLRPPRLAWKTGRDKRSQPYKKSASPPDDTGALSTRPAPILQLRQSVCSDNTLDTRSRASNPLSFNDPTWPTPRHKVKVRPPGQWRRFKKFRALRYGAERRGNRLPPAMKQVFSKTNYVRDVEGDMSQKTSRHSANSRRRQRRASPDLLRPERPRDQGGLASRSTPEVAQVFRQDEDLSDRHPNPDQPTVRLLLKPTPVISPPPHDTEGVSPRGRQLRQSKGQAELATVKVKGQDKVKTLEGGAKCAGPRQESQDTKRLTTDLYLNEGFQISVSRGKGKADTFERARKTSYYEFDTDKPSSSSATRLNKNCRLM